MKVWIVVLLSLSACLISSATEFSIVSSQESAETRSLQDQPRHLVILYDRSRNIWIKLTDDQAFFSTQGGASNAQYWHLIGQNPTGYWASDNEFVTTTGSFRQNYGGVVWLERQGGSGFNSYVRINQDDASTESTYIADSNSQRLVVLYDESRNYWIMLTDYQAFFNQQDGDPSMAYWHLLAPGYWITDKQFIMQAGYFRQKSADWWIQQQAVDVYNFVKP